MHYLDSTQTDNLKALASEAVIKNYHFEGLNWSEVGREGQIFENCQFTHVSFASSSLRELEAYRCQFLNCKFAHADLTEAIFDTCHFYDVKQDQGADFAYAQLKFAKFLDSDLSQASFKYADLFGITIKGCKAIAADFEHANFANKISAKVIFAQAEITNSILRFSRMPRLFLGACNLSGNDFTEADLAYTNLNEADLKNCILNSTQLTRASLENADIQYSEFNNIDLSGCQLQGLKISTDQCIPFLKIFGIEVLT